MNSSWGGHWGVPNTIELWEKLANAELLCWKSWNTDIAFMIGHTYLKFYPCHVFVFPKRVPEINLTYNHGKKTWKDFEFVDTQIEKPGNWMQ